MSAPGDPGRQQAGDEVKGLVDRPLSFAQTIQAVAWSFLGIRKRSGYEKDIAKLNPVHVIVAGIIGAVMFVASLVVIVNLVVPG